MNKQNQVIGALFTSLIITGSFSAPVFSQTETEINTTDVTQTESKGTASDLLIPARGSIQHDTFGDVHEGVTQFRGFFPLLQNSGSDLLYFNGGFNVDNSGNFGGSAIVGYRKYLEDMNRIFGGYFGWDNRETDKSTFDQLVMGVESLGDWDVRLNGFIPVGDTRNQILNYDTGVTAENIRFQDHYLMFDTNQEIRKIFESAVTGFDMEVGTKLTDLGDTGALRAYAGPYYYSADGGSDSLGFRLRLTANPTDYLNFGIGFQTDGIFGENVLFTVGANFPGTRAEPLRNEKDSVLARLGDNVFRNSTILVDRQEESETIATVGNKATNPDTDQPWFFNHVDLGNGNSNGTWESPYGTLAEGILGNGEGPAITTDGNGIVYIRGTGDIVEFPMIPGNVRVLSAGPLQNLLVGNIPGYTQIQLPESGAAVGADGMVNFDLLPRVVEPIVMANGTTSVTKLSGFNLDLASYYENNPVDETNNGAGIIVNEMIGDVRIEYNRIAGVPQGGIDVNLTSAGTGNLSIQYNDLNVTGVAGTEGATPTGIDLNLADGSGMGNLEILDNTINVTGAEEQDPSTLYGININSAEEATSGTIGNIDILNNEITVDSEVNGAEAYAYADGIYVSGGEGTTFGDVTISGNTLNVTANAVGVDDYAYAYGIYVDASGSTIGNITISGNTLNLTGDDPYGIDVRGDEGATFGDVTISGNTLNLTAEDDVYGIDVWLDSETTVGNVTISGNTLNLTGEDDVYGIDVRGGEGATFGDLSISGNTLTLTATTEGGETFSAGEGITIGLEGATTGDITIDNNTIDPYVGIGINLSDSTTGAISITNNDIAAYSYGIGVGLYNSDIGGDLTISGNTIAGTETNPGFGPFGELNGPIFGIIVGGEGSTINGNVNIQGNTVDAGIFGMSFGASVFGPPSTELTVTGDVNITDNTVNIGNTGYSYSIGAGIVVGGVYSNFNNININNNNITVDIENVNENSSAGALALGIGVQTYGTTMKDLTISGNTLDLTATADGAEGASFISGISVNEIGIGGAEGSYTAISEVNGINFNPGDENTIGNVTITGNKITAEGTATGGDYDSWFYGDDGDDGANSTVGNVTISNNTLDLTAIADGGEGVLAKTTGIRVFNGDDSTVNSYTISGNQIISNATATAYSYALADAEGINLFGAEGSTVTNNITISGNTLNLTATADDYSYAADADGIILNGYGATFGDVVISGNTLKLTGQDDVYGIYVVGDEGATIGDLTISGNILNLTGEDDLYGIYVWGDNDATVGDVTISGNTVNITTTGDDSKGIYVWGDDDATFGNVTISGNILNVTGEDDVYGIDVWGDDSATFGNVTISGNTLKLTGEDYLYGIDFDVFSATFENVVISNNIIDLTTADGGEGGGTAIYFSADGTTINQFRISDNILSAFGNNVADGIYTTLGTAITGEINNNTITDFGDDSIQLNGACDNLTVTGNTSINPGDQYVEYNCN